MKVACCVATVLGLAMGANGLLMLGAPQGWYFSVPGVTTTGPFNQHFVRDIGLIFLLLGGMFLAGVVQPALRTTLWSLGAAWLTGHALFHFWEVAVGICSTSAIQRDFAAVTLPAIFALVLAAAAIHESTVKHKEGM